ncbi:uncharacterized protein LOC127740495 [Arachis duranensis]|uniref:Uncharacterized protein LOC127740495 n=1 Tax=Arachis duranensis TaxID=130453 RepID=A0A9C6T0A5_ARADU|nr:uncharacterized protein LOC127740495 [Arachis duranensis]
MGRAHIVFLSYRRPHLVGQGFVVVVVVVVVVFLSYILLVAKSEDAIYLGFFANFLGIFIFVLVIAYHFVMADPRLLWL